MAPNWYRVTVVDLKTAKRHYANIQAWSAEDAWFQATKGELIYQQLRLSDSMNDGTLKPVDVLPIY